MNSKIVRTAATQAWTTPGTSLCPGHILLFGHVKILCCSMAAVYWDAQHIDEGVRFLKQHARPHA